MDSQCVANCVVREDFPKGAHPTSISVVAACDLEAFEQELFVRVVVTPWARAKDRQRGDAQAMRNTGGEEAREAKSERGMKRRRQGRESNAPTPSGTPSASGTEEDAEAEDEEGEDEERD